MRKVEINERGEITDAETHEVIGMRDGDGIRMFSEEERKHLNEVPRAVKEGKTEDEKDKLQGTADAEKQETADAPETPAETGQISKEEPKAHIASPLNQNASECKSAAVTGIPVKVPFSRYEVTPDSEFTVRFCIDLRDGRALVYTADAKDRHPDYESHWVVFRMWTFKEEMSWKKQCQSVDMTTRMTSFDNARFDELKIRNLIKSWSFEQYDPKLKLLHVGGVLSDESYELFKGLFPNIANNIIYLMNQVLECNQ